MEDYYDDNYMSPASRRESRRRWAEKGHYDHFLNRKNGNSTSLAWGNDSEDNHFGVYLCSQDKRHQTLEEYDSYVRIMIAMNEKDTALERWCEIRIKGKETIVLSVDADWHKYCDENNLILKEGW